MSNNTYGTVNTRPVKRFFVEMLTRDIALEDAILDLLDNCVDGILRKRTSQIQPEGTPQTEQMPPYNGFWAKITVNGDKFEIEDNCGGIPWDEHERAFRMGRAIAPTPEANGEPTLSVGVYGIGMKRAIFKMGDEALIRTQNGDDNYEVPISADWMGTEDDWDLNVIPSNSPMNEDGTCVIVSHLLPGVSKRFAAEAFESDLIQKIESHYAVIIRKGFVVTVNGKGVSPKPIHFRVTPTTSNGPEIRPYLFQSNVEGVEVFLAIGLREPIPGAERLLDEQTGVQFSSDYAGWTVICNDRVVLYCNRDELTGWGTAGLPQYHTQFIAISGVVEFRGDPKLLPTTTTKRGLDFSSALYQQVLNRMREGLRLFVNFTNRWKAREDEAKAQVSPVPAISYERLKEEVKGLNFAQVRTGLEGQQYKPKLPEPPNNAKDVRISYFREREVLSQLAEALLLDLEDIRERDVPRKVGEASFDFAFQQLVKDPAK